MLKLIGFLFAITTFALDEKEICHSKFFLGASSIVRNAVPIRAQFRAFGTTTFRKKMLSQPYIQTRNHAPAP